MDFPCGQRLQPPPHKLDLHDADGPTVRPDTRSKAPQHPPNDHDAPGIDPNVPTVLANAPSHRPALLSGSTSFRSARNPSGVCRVSIHLKPTNARRRTRQHPQDNLVPVPAWPTRPGGPPGGQWRSVQASTGAEVWREAPKRTTRWSNFCKASQIPWKPPQTLQGNATTFDLQHTSRGRCKGIRRVRSRAAQPLAPRAQPCSPTPNRGGRLALRFKHQLLLSG